MKKIISLVLAVALVMCLFTACSSSDNAKNGVVKVYNWGDYIDPAVIEMFTKETGIKVVYDTFETNEDMYLKVKNTAGPTYDVVIPSDYMIKKMIDEDMLAEINFDNVPNFANVDNKFKSREYDTDNKYSISYQFGTVCIAYNKDEVTEPVDSWNILWNEKYSGNIFMMNSQRDSIGVALMSLGYSINTTNKDELNQAKDLLIKQRPLVLAYTGDDCKDKMIGEEGKLAILWSCDAGLIMQETDKIGFAIPKEGTNIWFDAMVVLKNAENKENAEKFINFLCRDDIALMNAEYLGTASPVIGAMAQLPKEISENPVINPSAEDAAKYEVFLNNPELSSVYEEIWADVRFS